MARDLKYFMRNQEEEIITVPGPETIKDENGNVVNLEIRVLPQAEIRRINNAYRKRTMATDKKGNPLVANGEVIWKTEKDSERATRHIIVEALAYPNLKDEELMKYFKCVDVTEMPLKVFPRADEYAHVTRAVLTALGIIDGEVEDEAITDAKN